MENKKIRVGIIGLGGWAKYGHIPALQSLKEEFTIIAISSRKIETAREYAESFNIPHAFDQEQALITHPDVDLVVILAPAVEHARLAKAVIAAGKDVYCEWPLTTNTASSEELLVMADAKKVRHIVGFQRRLGPSARYLQALMKQNYVGQLRSVSLKVSADAFFPVMSEKHSWAFPASNFSNILSIYGGHFMDLLFYAVGFPKKFTSVIKIQFPHFIIEETGEKVVNTNPNGVMVIGTLEEGGLFTIQIEGAQKHCTGIHIEITGTDGILRITNALAFQNKEDNRVEGVNGKGLVLSHLPVPAEYQLEAAAHLDASIQDVACLYAAYARDRRNGTTDASNFRDALRQHHLIDQIMQKSEAFFNS